MILDGLNKQKRSLLIGLLNDEAGEAGGGAFRPGGETNPEKARAALTRALLNAAQLGRTPTKELQGDPLAQAARRVVRARMLKNDRTGNFFYRIPDQEDEAEVERAIAGSLSKFLQALKGLRGLPLEQLKTVFGPKLWRCRACGRYFEANDRRHRDYCSPKHGHGYEAAKAMTQTRAADRSKKLKAVTAALRSCPPGCDRKAWVAEKAGVSKNWITYAVARGEIALG